MRLFCWGGGPDFHGSLRWLRTLTLVIGCASSFGATAAPQVIDDITTYSYAQPAGPVGSTADLPVTRTFPGRIVSLQLTIVDGKADDIGYVGDLLVTSIFPACRDVGRVTTPVDVTSQVTINGNSASFLLRAVENCCCSTGWGPATQGDRPPATFHWQVTVDTDQCEPNKCGSECSSRPPTFNAKGAFSYKHDAALDCNRFIGGKFGAEFEIKGTGSAASANCANECKAKETLSGEMTVKALFCGGRSESVTGSLELERTVRYGTTCEPETCKKQCDNANSCLDSSVTGSVGLGVEQKYEIAFTKGVVGATSAPQLKAFCGFTLGLSGSVGVQANLEELNGSIDACESCQKFTGKLDTSGYGKAGCLISLGGGGWTRQTGCADCGALKLATSLDLVHATGACEAPLCAKSSLKLEATLQTPQLCFNVFGMVLKARAAGHVTESCSGDTCNLGSNQGCAPEPDTALDAIFESGINLKCDG